MKLQQHTRQEAGQGKWSPISCDSEPDMPVPSGSQRRRRLLALFTLTASLALAIGLAVVQPWALLQHQSLTMVMSDAQSEEGVSITELEETAANESVASVRKKLENKIDQVEKNMKKMLVGNIKKDIHRDVETDFKKDGDDRGRAKFLTKLEKDIEADLSQDVPKDVDRQMDKTFGHRIKKDVESQLNTHIPKSAQAVEKKEDNKRNSSKIVAAFHGCCTWTGKCDSSQAFCNVNQDKCKGCGGRWKTNTRPRDFAGSDTAWCTKAKMDSWALPSVPAYNPVSRNSISVKILDWNLEWFEVYKKKGGEGGQQGKWLASSGPYDIIGFQECQNPWQIMADGGIMDMYHAYRGGGGKDSKAICVLYKKDTWEELGHGEEEVAEDMPGKWSYYGKRVAVWFRLRHKETKESIMFVNHHGPLPLSSGGICGGHATAYNILEVIQNNSKVDDAIVLVGDFNAGADSLTLSQLMSTLTRCYSGWRFNGIDHVLTNFNDTRMIDSANLGGHGSDHDALSVTFKLGHQ